MDLDENCKPVDILVLDQNCLKEKCELYGEIIEHYPRRPRIAQQIAISELDHSKSGTNCCIKALVLVVNKSSIRTYFGGGGEGYVFSLELCDESSSIQMVSFNEACHMFYSEIQVPTNEEVGYKVGQMPLLRKSSQILILIGFLTLFLLPRSVIFNIVRKRVKNALKVLP